MRRSRSPMRRPTRPSSPRRGRCCGLDMDVLEFGCGTGSTAIVHAPFVSISTPSIFRPGCWTSRRRRPTRRASGISRSRATPSRTWTCADASYDVVMGHSILHLLKDKDAVIAKVMRLLKPGGLFVSSTACLGDTLKVFQVHRAIGQGVWACLPRLDVMTRHELLTAMRKCRVFDRARVAATAWQGSLPHRPKARMAPRSGSALRPASA